LTLLITTRKQQKIELEAGSVSNNLQRKPTAFVTNDKVFKADQK